MAKLFGLTAEQQQRLARVADKVEGQPIQRANQQSGTSKPSPSFWVELTEEDPDNPGRYAWKLVDYVDHEWTDRDPEIASPEDEYTAIEANGGSGMVGQRVELHFYGYDAEGKPRYLFGQTALPFMARIENAGPGGAANYPATDQRYWATPLRIAQANPTTNPEASDDEITRLTRATDGSERFTLINLAEYRDGALSPPSQGRIARKMLRPGAIVRVWTELDDQGVPRFVCHEDPYGLVWCRTASDVAIGDFEGVIGCYGGHYMRPSNAATVLTPSNLLQMSWSEGGCLMINLAERNQYHAFSPPGRMVLGWSGLGMLWGWTDPALGFPAPQRVVLFSQQIGQAPADTTSGKTGDDLLNAVANELGALKQTLVHWRMLGGSY